MKKRTQLISAAFGLLLSATSYAADVTIKHNINGTDLGLDQELPVDIVVNDNCFAIGVINQETLGPVELDAGIYDVQVRLSDGNCTGPLAIQQSVPIQFAENVTIVAHLSAAGTPELTRFENDVNELEEHSSRLSIRHAASAPEVKIYVAKSRRPKVIWELGNGDAHTAELRSGDYKVYVFDQQKGFTSDFLAGPIPVTLEPGTSTVIYAVGSLSNSTFSVDTQVFDGL